MEELRQYVISVTAAAMICGVVSGLTGKTGVKEGIRLLCGLFLTIAALAPLTDVRLSDLIPDGGSWFLTGTGTSALGEIKGTDAMAALIKTESEAYILDKASELNAAIAVDISLSDEEIPVPEAVVISGQISPYARQKLAAMLQNDLGITKENQIWTG